MSSVPGNLSLEQQFKLQVFQSQVQSLDLAQAQEYIMELLRQMMVKDNLVKNMLHTK
ncbi:MAG: phycobilisome degradation protein NblA [Symploca sp. SIO3C6]|nr:phycobilisome degradation protein NblA [Symploca sp. SIO3C6]